MARTCPNSGYQRQFPQQTIASAAPVSYQLPPAQYHNTSQAVTQQGRGRGGRGFVRGIGQASTSQQGGRGQARVFTLTQQEAQASNAVVAGTLPVCSFDAKVLFDPGATHSFVSPVFVLKSGWNALRMAIPLSVATPLSESFDSDVYLQNCPVLIKNRELLADLALLDVLEFDVILGMDWLSKHYATVDCRRKEVIFKIPNVEEFKFVGDKSSAPQNLISAITAKKMLSKGCQGYLTIVRDTAAEKKSISDVPVACEFIDVFPEELSGLPPQREIKFCIDVVSDTAPISMPPYRMAPAELKELKE